MSISKMYPGKTHDFKIRKTSDPFSENTKKYVDLGYLGIEKTQTNVNISFKKTKK